jgi:hypothetical protein
LKKLGYILLVICVCTGINASAQLYLVVQKRGTVKNHKYEIGNEISFQTIKGDFYINGKLSKITDSIITIDNLYDIELDNIGVVFKQRRSLRKISKLFFIRGGIAYTTIVGINGVINNDSPLIDEQTLIISASMVAIGLLMKPFYVKKMDVTEKWQLKVLDFENVKPD